jgi:hypothetical protein
VGEKQAGRQADREVEYGGTVLSKVTANAEANDLPNKQTTKQASARHALPLTQPRRASSLWGHLYHLFHDVQEEEDVVQNTQHIHESFASTVIWDAHQADLRARRRGSAMTTSRVRHTQAAWRGGADRSICGAQRRARW